MTFAELLATTETPLSQSLMNQSSMHTFTPQLEQEYMPPPPQEMDYEPQQNYDGNSQYAVAQYQPQNFGEDHFIECEGPPPIIVIVGKPQLVVYDNTTGQRAILNEPPKESTYYVLPDGHRTLTIPDYSKLFPQQHPVGSFLGQTTSTTPPPLPPPQYMPPQVISEKTSYMPTSYPLPPQLPPQHFASEVSTYYPTLPPPPAPFCPPPQFTTETTQYFPPPPPPPQYFPQQFITEQTWMQPQMFAPPPQYYPMMPAYTTRASPVYAAPQPPMYASVQRSPSPMQRGGPPQNRQSYPQRSTSQPIIANHFPASTPVNHNTSPRQPRPLSQLASFPQARPMRPPSRAANVSMY